MKKNQRKSISKNPNQKTVSLGKFDNIFESNAVVYTLLGIVILIIAIARIHLLSVPFERDEGEYAYIGALILDGHTPYTLAYNMKYPGTYFMYAMIMGIFGRSVEGVHIGLMLVSIASIILMYLISNKIISKSSSVFAASSFGIISTSWTLFGQAGHATFFVIFFVLIGILFLIKSEHTKEKSTLFLILSGIFFALGFISKQSGLFFIFFGMLYILIKDYKVTTNSQILKKIILLSAGFAIPVLLMYLYFYIFGDFEKFWFWTYTYLSKYGSQMSLSQGYDNFILSLRIITGNYTSEGYVLLWFIGIIGLCLLYFINFDIRKKIITIIFVLMSFLTVVPGLYFRNHYYITFLPAIALLIGVFFEYFRNIYYEKLKLPFLTSANILFYIIILSIGISANSEYLFKRDNNITCKLLYGANPFVESLEIAEFLKANTDKNDKIAILGSEPQIYFYSERLSATGYIYTYNLVELHEHSLTMQKEMISEIIANEPKYIVFMNLGMSWLSREESEKYIFKWIGDYTNDNYVLVGVTDITDKQIGNLMTGNQLINFKTKSGQMINIYKRL